MLPFSVLIMCCLGNWPVPAIQLQAVKRVINKSFIYNFIVNIFRVKSKVWFDAMILIALTFLAKGFSIQFSDELAAIFKNWKRETVPRFLYLCFTDCL